MGREPHSLRTFLTEMEGRGELIRVRKPVDPRKELPALASETTRPILFESIEGYDGWRVADCLLRFRSHQAVALRCSPENLIPHLALNYMKGAGKTRVVTDAPVKEVVWKADDANLTRLPCPTPSEGIEVPHLKMAPNDFHIPTITGGFGITKDPVTNVQNTFFPSTSVLGPRRAQFYVFSPHTLENLKRYKRMGQRAPMAIVIGCHPAYEVAAVYTGPHVDYSELEITATILEETVELVRAETVDLLVPAHAEIVIEGTIDSELGRYVNVASHTDTYAPIVSRQPYLDVTAITMRKDAIYRHIQPTRWTDHHALCEFIIAPMLYGMLKGKGIPVTDVTIPLHSSINCAVIQMTPRSEEDVREALLTAMGMPFMPRITVVVDEDVDIHDANDLLYALSIRVDPARDIYLQDGLRTFEEDPLGRRIRGREEDITTSIGRLAIDATKPPPCRPTERIYFERLRARGEGRVFLKDFIEDRKEAVMPSAQPTHLRQDPRQILAREQGRTIEKVTDGIHCIYGLANSGVVIGEKGVAVIDTTTSPPTARKLVEIIRGITNKPILYAINTHYHGDHNYGNVVFRELGAKIVGLKKTAQLMKAREKRVKAFYLSRALPMADVPVVVPDATFEDETTLDLGKKTLLLKFFGATETDDAISVYAREDKVLFVGDSVIPYGFPIFGMPVMNEGLNNEGWIHALDRLLDLDVRYVVCGHGLVSDKTVIQWMRDIAAFIWREVTAQVDQAKSLQETIDHVMSVMPKEWVGLPRIWGTPQAAVMRVYHALTGWIAFRSSAIEPAPADQVEDALRRVGRSAESLLEEAEKAAMDRDFPLACSLADLACRTEPRSGRAHAILGDILFDWGASLQSIFDMGDFFCRGREETEKALELDPECPISYVNAAMGLLGTRAFTGADPAAAIDMIETAFRKGLQGPRLVKAFYALGMAYEAQGNAAKARQHYKQALDMFPGLDPAREALERLSKAA